MYKALLINTFIHSVEIYLVQFFFGYEAIIIDIVKVESPSQFLVQITIRCDVECGYELREVNAAAETIRALQSWVLQIFWGVYLPFS